MITQSTRRRWSRGCSATAAHLPRSHSLNSRPHFSRARLSAAPFTTSTRRASSFYAFIYAPFIIFKVRLFLARRRATVIYFLPPGLPATVCCCVPRFIFIFLLLIMELVFLFFTLLLGACVFIFYFCVKRRAVDVVFFFINRASHWIIVIKG